MPPTAADVRTAADALLARGGSTKIYNGDVLATVKPDAWVVLASTPESADAVRQIGWHAVAPAADQDLTQGRIATALTGRNVLVEVGAGADRQGVLSMVRLLLDVARKVAVAELPTASFAELVAAGGGKRDLKLYEVPSGEALQGMWGLDRAASEPNKSSPVGESGAGEWPEPAPVNAALPPVAPFDPRFLPEVFRPWVRDIAERMQVPMDMPASAMVVALAGAVSRRATVQPKRYDTGWVVTPNLWGGVVAPPGYKKSPVIEAAIAPLASIDRDWATAYSAELAEYQESADAHELKLQAHRELSKSAIKRGSEAPPKPEPIGTPPTLKRILVHDATVEALHRTMAENPSGLLMVCDELTGWLARLDTPGQENSRAFHLTAWNGNSPYTTDRIGRGKVHAEAVCLSIVGGIQPARLRGYLSDAVTDGPGNDGLLQRFQVLVWPDLDPQYRHVDRAPNREAEQRVVEVFTSLVNRLEVGRPPYRFDHAAQELFDEWSNELETKVRGDDLHPALVGHLAKYRSLMPALSLLFWLADNAATPHGEISLGHARQAAATCEYLEAHARRVYSCVTTRVQRSAAQLAQRIATGKIGAEGAFTLRDLYQKNWASLDTPEAAQSAVDRLVDLDWLRPVDPDQDRRRGRPASARYLVNPKAQTPGAAK